MVAKDYGENLEIFWILSRIHVSRIISHLSIISPQSTVMIWLLNDYVEREIIMNTTSLVQSLANKSEASVRKGVTNKIRTSIVLNIAKSAGALALYLGILSWKGIIQSPIPFHIISGLILGLVLVVVGHQAIRAGFPMWMAVVVISGGVGFSIFGAVQNNLLHNYQSVMQVFHLVGGLAAIGISVRLANNKEKIAGD